MKNHIRFFDSETMSNSEVVELLPEPVAPANYVELCRRKCGVVLIAQSSNSITSMERS
jgi:hypothetical protein